MKKWCVVLWFLMLSVHIVPGQNLMATQGGDSGYNAIPGESVFVHHNTSLLFAGETFYYKIYCMNTADKKPSGLSKIAYVALVGTDRQPVFQQKVRLLDGLGQGDFFVPATVPTGSYKLLAYTQWMKNGRGTPVFESDIMLINPYLNTTERHRELIPPADSLESDSLETRVVAPAPAVNKPLTFNNMQLTTRLDKQVYGKRDLVTLELAAANNAVPGGEYSISVRRSPVIPHPESKHAPQIPVLAGNAGVPDPDTVVLPELRGELITGRITSAQDGQQLNNIPLAVSFVGDEFVFDMARTDSSGKFYFNINSDYEEDTGIFQVFAPDAAAYDIQIEAHSLPMEASTEFYDFSLSAGLAREIQARSIRNQIENAYEEVKADTVVPIEGSLPFYRAFQLHYRLDDFTRFNTIEETLVEVVDHVWLSKTPAGAPMFQVRPFDVYLDGIGMAPMVFMDGLFIQNHGDITGFPARRIKNIFISRDRYQVGANVFQGILAFETYSSDFADSFFRDFLKPQTLFKPEPRKSYYFEHYGPEQDKNRIPDFREQLYWDPDLEISGVKDQVQWYTSDLDGTYEIRIEGYATNGRPVSLTTLFTVE